MLNFFSRFTSPSNVVVFTRYCEKFYPNKQDGTKRECAEIVTKINGFLSNINAESFCEQAGFCQDARYQASPDGMSAPELSARSINDECVDVFKGLKQRITSATFRDDLYDHLVAFCDVFAMMKSKEECNLLLENSFDNLIQYIKHTRPQKFCNALTNGLSN